MVFRLKENHAFYIVMETTLWHCSSTHYKEYDYKPSPSETNLVWNCLLISIVLYSVEL